MDVCWLDASPMGGRRRNDGHQDEIAGPAGSLPALGPPILFWLFFARDNVRRLVAVLFMLVFIQDSFVNRRFVWAISFGPATIMVYVALLSLIVQRGRLPNLAPYGGAWVALLFFASFGALAGAVGGYPFENFYALQRLFLEAFLFFLTGYLVFRSDADLQRFFRAFVWVGLGVAAAHLFALVTGFRFRDHLHRDMEGGGALRYGGLFENPNSLGDFYAMAIPVALMLAVRGGRGAPQRIVSAAAVPVMLASLFLTASRGGMLATFTVVSIAFLWSRVGIGRTLVVMAVSSLLVASSYLVLSTALSEYFTVILRYLGEQRLETPRTVIWPCYLGVILRHPLGLGFAPENTMPVVAAQCGLVFSTAHNIYLDLAAQSGVGSLIAFLFLVGVLLRNTARAVARAIGAQQRLLLTLCFLPPAGFLIGGIFEPTFINSPKLNHVFWLFAGVGAGASTRVLAEAREREAERGRASGLLPAEARGV
jgi:O-antigen ligase